MSIRPIELVIRARNAVAAGLAAARSQIARFTSGVRSAVGGMFGGLGGRIAGLASIAALVLPNR
jgi:hypothetical protein